MDDKIKIIKKVEASTCMELKQFIGKTLKRIRGEYLNFTFEKPEQVSTTNYCHFEFSDKCSVHVILLYTKNNFNKFCGYFPTLEVKVISKKKPNSKSHKVTEINNFYKDIFKSESIFNPDSVISFQNSKELVLEQLIFFGYEEDTTFIAHLSELSSVEKAIQVNLIEGLIFRFKGNKEIIVRSREDNSFDIKISSTIDENSPTNYIHEIGWKTKTILSI